MPARLASSLRLLVAVGVTVGVLWRANLGDVGAALGRTSWTWVGGAVLLVLVDRSLMAYRWIALLAPLSAQERPSTGSVLRIFFVSTFVGTFLPSVGGDAYRVWCLTREGAPAPPSVASVLLDRLLGVVSILLSGVAGLAMLPGALSVQVLTWSLVLSLSLVAAGCALALALVFSVRVDDWTRRWLTRLSHGRVRHTLERLLDALQAYRARHGVLALVLAASVGVQALRILQAWLLGRGLGLDVPLLAYFAVIPLILLVMQLPITVSGLGTGNAAFVWTFAWFLVPAADAFALSVLFIALGPLGNLPGGLLYAFGPRKAAA